MSERLHDLFIIQHKITAGRSVWMFGMKARTEAEGVLIYSDERRLVLPTEMQWGIGHELLITSKESISAMSATSAKHVINLIKTVRANGNTIWMYHVIVTLRIAGTIDLDTCRKWKDVFKALDPDAEVPVLTLPYTVGQSTAITAATNQSPPSQFTANTTAAAQSTSSQPTANTTAAGQPTAPPCTAGIAAVHQSVSDNSMPGGPTGCIVTSGKSTAGQFTAPQPRAAQPKVDQPKASQSTADQSAADKPGARQSPAGPLAAAISAAEAAKLQTSSRTKVQMPPVPVPSKDPRKSSSPGGSGDSHGDPHFSKASRTRSGTSAAASSGKKTERAQRKV
jgi:hypothetical protein